jgi:hypothetical protein
MPIQHAIWKVGANPEPLVTTTLANEQELEKMFICTQRGSTVRLATQR